MENDCWKQPLKEFHKTAAATTENPLKEKRIDANFFEPIFLSQAGRALRLLLSTLHGNSYKRTHTRSEEKRNKIIYRLIIISGWL